ncbi:MAG: autotransporter assembly complex family protein [Hyphomonadaceae bacterium]
MRLFPVLPAALAAAIGFAADPPSAWSASPVVLEGADEETREAILDLLPDRDRPESLFDAERIAEEAAARAMAWLRSEGYYAAEVTPQAQEEPPLARLVIAPGSRFRFAAPELAYSGIAPGAEAADAARRALQIIEPGAPARAAIVLTAEGEAVDALQRAGYADAEAQPRRVLVDHATGLVTPNFNIAANAFARLGTVRAEPPGVLRPDFVARLQNWEDGQPYSPDRLVQLRRDLTSTGAVARATTRLAPADAANVRDMIIDIEAAPRNAYEVGLGYSTTEGVGVDTEWTRRNLTGRADSLTVGSTLGELRQGASVELLRPHAAGLGYARRYAAAVSREETDAFTRQGAALTYSVDAAQRLNFAMTYGVQLSADWYEDLGGDISDAVVLSTFAELRNDTRDNRFDPREGSLVALRLEPSIAAGDASLAFARTTADGRIYESFLDDDRLTLAARTRLGWLAPISGDVEDAPPDRRFYAGGGGSVRGYEYNSIYPLQRERIGLTPGGQGLVEGSVEARWRFGDRFGVVGFVDGGSAFDHWEDAADLRYGAGVGVRYDLGFAPLRVDIASPIDPRPGDPDYALYISIGQAF